MFATGLKFSLIWATIGMALTKNCPNPPSFENSHSEVNGNVTTYFCNSGFKFQGKNRNFACVKGFWIGNKFTCQKTCGAPIEFEDADIIHAEEELVTYKYHSGYNLTSKCLENEWSLDFGNCSKPVTIPDSIKEIDYDGNVMYSCKPGYIQVGNISTSFCENGTWTETNISCVAEDFGNCSKPMTIPDSIKEIDYDGNIMYSCKPGYTQVGNISMSFCENGTWTETNISCVPEDFGNCSKPMTIPDSIKEIDYDGNIMYSCKPGYTQIGNISMSFCENGTWTETNISCIPEDSENCPEPVNIPDSTKQMHDGRKVSYTCKSEYIQIGNISTSFCENGTWTETNMNCVPEICGPPPSMEFSRVFVDRYIANFTCEPEYLLIGNVSVSICENNTWSNINMICVSKAAIALEKRQHQRSKEFQKKIENTHSLICSFLSDKQSCRCNNEIAVMVPVSSNQSIIKHKYMSLKATSEKECDNFCLKNEMCLSSEFIKNRNLCQLSKTMMDLVDQKFIRVADGAIYKEKKCVPSSADEVQEKHPAFNFTTVSLNSLLCSVVRNDIYCGCIEGRISFKIQLNKKIARHNMYSFDTSDQKECSNRCKEVQKCLSAEYKQYKKLCHLSQTAHYLANDVFLDSPKTVYLEKMCTPFSSF